MKRRTLLIALLMFAMLLGLSACAGKVESISVEKLPTKVEYTVGDTELDLTGGMIEVLYEDGSARSVRMDKSTVKAEGFDTSKAGTVKITLTYLKQECSFNINVVAGERELKSISVKNMPTKTTYLVDSQLDLTGGTIQLNYENGSEVISMTAEGVTVKPYSMASVGKVAIVLMFGGFEASFDVTVEAPSVQSISIHTLPTKLLYNIGETVDLKGGIIKANYNDGTLLYVNMSACTASYDFSSEGMRTVEIDYLGSSASFEVEVARSHEYTIDYDYLSEMVAGMETNISGVDDMLYLHYYYEFARISEEVYASKNTAVIAEYELLYREILVENNKFYQDWFVEYLPQTLNSETGLEYVKAMAYATYEYTFNFVIGFKAYFDRVEELHAELEDVNKYECLEFINSYLYYYVYMKASSYYAIVGFTEDETNTLFTFAQVDIFYSAWTATQDSIYFDEFYYLMQTTIERYKACATTVNFDAVFLSSYEYWVGVYETHYDPVLYISNLVEIAYEEWNNYNDTYFFYYYYLILEAVEEIYDSNDEELIARYENVKNELQQLLDLCYDWYVTEVSGVFSDPLFREFLILYGYAAVMYYDHYDAFVTSDEFDDAVIDIMARFEALSQEQRVTFAFYGLFTDISSYYAIIELGAEYYYKLTGSEHVAQTYIYMREAKLYIDLFVILGEGYSAIIEIVESYLIPSYNSMSEEDRTIFDKYLLTMYSDLLALYAETIDIVVPEYEWSKIDTCFAEMNGMGSMYETIWLYFFFELEKHVEIIYADEALKAYFDIVYGAKYSRASSKFKVFYNASPLIFDDENLNDFLVKYVNFIYIYEYILMRSYTSTYNDTVQELIDLYLGFTFTEVGMFTYALGDFYSYFSNITPSYYNTLLNGSLAGVWYMLISARIFLAGYEYEGIEAFLGQAQYYMTYATLNYNGLSEENLALFEEYFGELYDDLIARFAVYN